MTYIYDILLNFNENFYEFFEWEKGDNIYHLKKIPILKVESKVIDDFYCNIINIDIKSINFILNKCEMYEKKHIKYLKFCFLLTDGYKVIGVLIKDKKILLSDLLLDEELDVLDISKRCDFMEIAYNIIDKKNINYFNTRGEIKLKNNLASEINNIYNEKKYDKLKYLYFELFNEHLDNIDLIYKKLMESLNNINDKHYKLYELIKLCNKNIYKKTSNLTN